MSDSTNVKALVIGSKDYRDKDKLLTLYSLEQGKISAVIKGVKNNNAKYKAVKELFCFADFIYTENLANKVITNATIIENFFDITKDPEKYFFACQILKILNFCLPSEDANAQLFISLLKILKLFTYETCNAKICFIKFLMIFYASTGYKLKFNLACDSCKGILLKKYFDWTSNSILCYSCKSENSSLLSDACFSSLRLIDSVEIEKLSTLKIKEDFINDVLSFNEKYLMFHYNFKLEKSYL